MFVELGYGLTALGYALLLLLLLTVKKSGLAKYLLIIATGVTCFWSISHSQMLFGPMSLEKLFVLDASKLFVWVLFLTACLRDDFKSLNDVLSRPVSWAILALPISTVVLPLIFEIKPSWRLMLLLGNALLTLILLEVIYRQTSENRWAFKPLVIFLGATSLFEFATYASASIVGQVDAVFIQARSYLYLLMLPFLVIAIRRIQHWGVNIFISRDIVLHSSLLMVAGGYLIVMGLAGYLIPYLGGEWSTSIQITLAFLSLAMLLTLLMSNSFRTRISVFITKHFFANQFDYRQEWVKLTDTLSQETADLSQVYAVAGEALLGALDYQHCTILKAKGQQYFDVLVSDENIQITPEAEQFLHKVQDFFQQKNWIIDIQELRVTPFHYEGLKINHALLNSCQFELVLPLHKQGKLWGLALLASGGAEKRQLNWELRDYLSAVTAQVVNYLMHNEAANEVAENAQFAAFTRMSAFVLHDLKNVMAQIDLILCNAAEHKDNPEFIDDTFETLFHTKARMDKMLRQLTDKEKAGNKLEELCLVSELAQAVIEQKCAGQLPMPSLDVVSETRLVLDSEKFSNVLYHLISNAQQATEDSGQVTVKIELTVDQSQLMIDISDTGCGMTQEFIRERLFKPFDTTKGNAGMGVGAYDAKNFIEKTGGHLKVESQEGSGSTFTLVLPTN